MGDLDRHHETDKGLELCQGDFVNQVSLDDTDHNK
jgi:hypothetical protein